MEDDVTRNIEEQLSAFLDGELPEEELQLLVRRLEREPAYRATLARYSLGGSILRNDPVLSLSTGMREEIMDAVESDVGVETPAVSKAGSGLLSLGRRSAVAAAVMVGLAVLGANQWNASQESPQVAVNALSAAQMTEQKAEALRAAQPVYENQNRQSVRAVARRRSPVNRDRMTSYMVSHGEFSRSFHGTMVDSRIFVQQASFEE